MSNGDSTEALEHKVVKEVLVEVANERGYQLERFGNKFDDGNKPNDWISYIAAYSGRAYSSKREGYTCKLFRESMIKTAALAVAAVEAYDRNTK